MAGSTYGTLFRITTWGESHGPAIGVVIDGCPSGLSLSEEDIQKQLDRRKPGQSKFTTKRNESDTAQILSGVFEGKTTGTPISVIVYNQDQRSRDYGKIKDCYRPGHADYTFDAKYKNAESRVVIPADLPEGISNEIRSTAIKAFKAVDGKGLSRVDFFVENGTNKIIINEINTLPGFTQISMYPKLWEEAGIKYSDLLDELIKLAKED